MTGDDDDDKKKKKYKNNKKMKKRQWRQVMSDSNQIPQEHETETLSL